MKEFLLTCLKTSAFEMAYILGVVIAAGLILELLERKGNEYIQHAVGWKGIVITAWLGTPVHELGHAIMCVLFGHKINEMKLFIPNSPDGTLGYVNHSYNKWNLYQRCGNFFIAIGPIFSGIAVLIGSMYLLLPKTFVSFKDYFTSTKGLTEINVNFFIEPIKSSGNMMQTLFSVQNFSNPAFWGFIAIAICVSSHIALSFADMKGAFDGLVCIFVLLFITNGIAMYYNKDIAHFFINISKYNAYIISFVMIAILFSVLTFIVKTTLYKLKKTIR